MPTPVLHSNALSRRFGCEVWLKLEGLGPTGSHKDRESLAIIEECRRASVREIGCASTGNFGVSLAYHARQARMACHVWVSAERAHGETIALLETLGAIVHVAALDLSALYQESSVLMTRLGIYNANPGACPAKIAANAEIGRELVAQISGVTLAICCVNNGTHLLGVAEGINGSSVRLAGVYSYSPLATSIFGFCRAEGAVRIENTVTRTGGILVEAAEEQLRDGLQWLGEVGITAEASSAAVIGVLPALRLSPHECVCCVITANGQRKRVDETRLLDSNESVQHGGVWRALPL